MTGLDVGRLAKALEILRTPKAQENVWWEAEIYPKARLTHFGFADRIAAEYLRLPYRSPGFYDDPNAEGER